MALQHEVGVGRDLQVDGAAADHVPRFVPQQPSQRGAVQVGRNGSHCRQQTGRIAAEHHGQRHLHPALAVDRQRPGRLVVRKPADRQASAVHDTEVIVAQQGQARGGVGRKRLGLP